MLREIGYTERVEKVGLFRAYLTRHGEGPFVTEDEVLSNALPDTDNDDHGPQGKFRVGWFDLVTARYALAVSGGADSLAITNLDRFSQLEGKKKIAVAYEAPQGNRVEDLVVKTALQDLAVQEKMTNFLNTVTPVYADVPDHTIPHEYLQMIEENLKVPITVTSHGPVMSDKRTRAQASVAA